MISQRRASLIASFYKDNKGSLSLDEMAQRLGLRRNSLKRHLAYCRRLGLLTAEDLASHVRVRAKSRASPNSSGSGADPGADGSAETASVEGFSIDYARARVQQLESENKQLRIALGQQQAIADAIAVAVRALPPHKPYKYQKPKRSRNPVVAVMVWSDLHIGEIILPEETEYFGEFNWQIAQERFYAMVESFLRWVDVQRYAYPIDEIVIMGLGDYCAGLIHDELLMTQEFPPPVQAVNAGDMIAEGLRRCAAHAKKIMFYGVGADNHGRLFRKPVAKRKYQSNFSFVTHAVARRLTARVKNIVFVEATGMKHLAEVNGFRFLCEHGDTVRAWMGIPYYGLERARGREAVRRLMTDRGFDYMTIGHWHVPGKVSGNIIINGSLTGTSEYDHAAGRHAPPAQIAFLVHPEWGVFNYIEFSGVKRRMEASARVPEREDFTGTISEIYEPRPCMIP